MPNNDKNKIMSDHEYRFTDIVWEKEPIASSELVKLCQAKFEWKKSTTYTVLKKLCDKGILKNENAIVTALVEKRAVQIAESKNFMSKNFNNSLPGFITAFMTDRTLTQSEAEELKNLIEKYTEQKNTVD